MWHNDLDILRHYVHAINGHDREMVDRCRAIFQDRHLGQMTPQVRPQRCNCACRCANQAKHRWLNASDVTGVTPPASPGARRRFRSLYVRDLS